MKRRLINELEHLRVRMPAESIIDDYPVDLLLGYRTPAFRSDGVWQSLVFDRRRLNYGRLLRRGAVDVIFHHATSGVMVVSPSLSSGLQWRIIYPGDGVLCSHSILAVNEALSIRYEIATLTLDWVREALEIETPWFVTPQPSASEVESGDGDEDEDEAFDDPYPAL